MAEVWWLSYVDPDRPPNQRFLGAAIVRVIGSVSIQNGMAGAYVKAKALGITPPGNDYGVHGEIMNEVKARLIPQEFWHKLLSRADVLRLMDALRDMVK